MKDAKDVICACIDHGYYSALAERLARDFKHVYYNSNSESEFQCVAQSIYGDGMESVERTEDYLDPKIFNDIDLFVFPEIGYSSLQKHLRSLGKAVWGSFDATNLEMYRTQFLDFVKDCGLPVAPSVKIQGLTDLEKYLKDHPNVYVKIDRFRGDMETFHWIDEKHGQAKMAELACTFGPLRECPWFVVQDPIEATAEIGYDGWFIAGEKGGYPESSFYGYEGKNETALLAMRKYTQLPKQIRQVNEAIKPKLDSMGYRNFMSTEIRVDKSGKPFFIDPTFRQAGMTCEQLQETCENLGEIIWNGANGIVVQPKWKYRFAASTTIHYNGSSADQWKVLEVPEKVKPWVKLAHYCEYEGMAVIPPCGNDELGVIIAAGNSVTETLTALRANVDALGDQPFTVETEGFVDLIEDIRKAEQQGMKFSDSPLPSREQVSKLTL